MDLEGKAALITGAASGIGRVTAQRFVAAGARVAIADLDAGAARAAASDLGGPRHAVGIAMDVTREDQVEQGFADAAEALGGLDVLVSNAGVQVISPLVELDLARWRSMLAVHLDGAFLTTRAAMRRMAAQGRGGSIVYMGSVHSKEASALKAPYVAAKHGLLGLARVVAKEGAPHGIRANVVCPGFVRTPLVDRQIPEQARALGLTEAQVVRDVMLKDTVDGTFTTAEDVAEAVLFLAAFPSAALTGQSLVVSHGWCMS